MPAYPEEVKAAEEEGIKIDYLTAPLKILGENGKVTGLECIQTELGEPDMSGRRRPIPVKGSEYIMGANVVILAIGEKPDLSFLETRKFNLTLNNGIEVNSFTLMTNVPGVFAGGDVVSGPATVIEAIVAGRKAALSIDKYLGGQSIECEELMPHTIGLGDVDTDRFNKREGQRMLALPPEKRAQGFEEVKLGFAELEALRETDRCFQCGLFPKKDK